MHNCNWSGTGYIARVLQDLNCEYWHTCTPDIVVSLSSISLLCKNIYALVYELVFTNLFLHRICSWIRVVEIPWLCLLSSSNASYLKGFLLLFLWAEIVVLSCQKSETLQCISSAISGKCLHSNNWTAISPAPCSWLSPFPRVPNST